MMGWFYVFQILLRDVKGSITALWALSKSFLLSRLFCFPLNLISIFQEAWFLLTVSSSFASFLFLCPFSLDFKHNLMLSSFSEHASHSLPYLFFYYFLLPIHSRHYSNHIFILFFFYSPLAFSFFSNPFPLSSCSPLLPLQSYPEGIMNKGYWTVEIMK